MRDKVQKTLRWVFYLTAMPIMLFFSWLVSSALKSFLGWGEIDAAILGIAVAIVVTGAWGKILASITGDTGDD